MYENGEEEVVDIKRVEPDGDFDLPCSGATMCCKHKGGKYTATVIDIDVIDDTIEVGT